MRPVTKVTLSHSPLWSYAISAITLDGIPASSIDNAPMRIGFAASAETIAPARRAASEGQGGRLVDAAGDGARRHIGGDHAEFGETVVRIGQRLGPDGGREHHVAIERGVDRIDGAGETVLRHDGETIALR